MRSLLIFILVSPAAACVHGQQAKTAFDRNLAALNEKLLTIQNRIKHLENELCQIEARMAEFHQNQSSVGMLTLETVWASSLRPHFDAIRKECQESNLQLSVDETTNALIYVTTAKQPIESSIHRWIERALENGTITSAEDATTTPLRRRSILVPSEIELQKRFARLRRLDPERYRFLGPPNSSKNLADIDRKL